MVVFFDIDGTLIDDESQVIPQSTIRAIRALRENGHIALVNTGRPFTHIDPRIRKMDFRGWVCGCGMEVQLDGQWLRCLRPSREMMDLAVQTARDCRMMPLYEQEDGALLLDGEYSRHPAITWEVEHMAEKGFAIRRMADTPDWKFMKHIAYYDSGSDLNTYVQTLEPYFTVIYRANQMLELVVKGASKAGGMQLVLDSLHTGKENAMAIGDSTNDLPMFGLAGHTVCMGNGMAQLKAAAEYVTDDVLHDGIENALKRYRLI